MATGTERIIWGGSREEGRRRCLGHQFRHLRVDPENPIRPAWINESTETELHTNGNVVEVTFANYRVELTFSAWVLDDCPVQGENGFRPGYVGLQFPGRLIGMDGEEDLVAILTAATPTGVVDGRACKMDFTWVFYPSVSTDEAPEGAVLIA